MNQSKIDSTMKDFRSTAMEGMTARGIAHRDDVKALAWDLNMWLRKTLEANFIDLLGEVTDILGARGIAKHQRKLDQPEVAGIIDGLCDQIEKLREAGGYLLGWHPTDPKHPAFADTQRYGRDMMCRLLARYEVVRGD